MKGAFFVRNRLGFQILAVPVILAAFGLNCVAQHSTTWGRVDRGLRLGLSVDRTNTNLRAILENTSSTALSVLAGMSSNSGFGIDFNFDFVATGRDGTKYKIWCLKPVTMALARGLVLPVVITVDAGATRELVFPMRNLVYMAKGGEISLKTLLEQGCTFTASLEVRQKDLDGAQMGGIPQPTVGRLCVGLVTCRLDSPRGGR